MRFCTFTDEFALLTESDQSSIPMLEDEKLIVITFGDECDKMSIHLWGKVLVVDHSLYRVNAAVGEYTWPCPNAVERVDINQHRARYGGSARDVKWIDVEVCGTNKLTYRHGTVASGGFNPLRGTTYDNSTNISCSGGKHVFDLPIFSATPGVNSPGVEVSTPLCRLTESVGSWLMSLRHHIEPVDAFANEWGIVVLYNDGRLFATWYTSSPCGSGGPWNYGLINHGLGQVDGIGIWENNVFILSNGDLFYYVLGDRMMSYGQDEIQGVIDASFISTSLTNHKMINV